MSAREYLTPEGAAADEPAGGPEPAELPPDRAIGARHAWLMVAAALLLGPALVLAVLAGPAGAPELRLALWAVPGGLVVLLVALAARTAAPRARSVIIGTVIALAAGGVFAASILPLVLPPLGLRGSGVVWTAEAVDGHASWRPLGVLGDTALFDDEDGVLFVALADGRVIGRAPGAGPAATATRPVLAGDGVLIRSADGFRRYDRAGRPTWPDPVPADRVVAHDAGISALVNCSGGQCLIEGYDEAGARVWQFEAAYNALHQPGGAESDAGALPTQLAVQDRSEPDGAPRWLLYSAATGKRTGTIEGKAIQLIDRYAITLAGADFGPCLIRLSSGPTEAVDCVSPWSTHVRRGLLIVEQRNGYAAVLRPGAELEGAELFETATALGRTPGTDLGERGRARLADGVVEAWRWTAFTRSDLPPTWRSDALTPGYPAPFGDPRATEPPTVFVTGSSVVVIGTALPEPFGIGGPETQLVVLDLADGSETARLRFPSLPVADLRDRIGEAGDGRILLTLPGRPPMLLGR